MTETSGTGEAFDLSGGALCLDLANTLGDRPRGSEERLRDYADLLAWANQAGLLERSELDDLRAAATARPDAAATTFDAAIDLRETVYRLFAALARGDEPPADDLEALNRHLARALPHLRVACADGCREWTWRGGDDLDRPLWPVARSTANLLTSDEVAYVRECASDTCSWLFVDRSRTRRRKWCDMSTCGNRAKARRHYHRQKKRLSG